MIDVAANVARLRNELGDRVTIVAVTKTVPPEQVTMALHAGITVFGENRVQEAKAKIPQVPGRARWHMIGHLQTNKVRDAVMLFEMIQSVDSVRLAREIEKWAERLGRTMPVLLEVNVAGERSKYGFRPEDLPGVMRELESLRRVEVRGLMTVPPFCEDVEQVRPYFRRLRQLRDELGLAELSMGMSHDYRVAVEEGVHQRSLGALLERVLGIASV
ncbi:MAG: YggS family pyridoxal phosphate-dependent enzyme, partial [Verrucomicrobiae bacterium]|nr:YggS family pyridoxal phosphate-dependent enzyme [Verrucomicrobiae bacterium]